MTITVSEFLELYDASTTYDVDKAHSLGYYVPSHEIFLRPYTLNKTYYRDADPVNDDSEIKLVFSSDESLAIVSNFFAGKPQQVNDLLAHILVSYKITDPSESGSTSTQYALYSLPTSKTGNDGATTENVTFGDTQDSGIRTLIGMKHSAVASSYNKYFKTHDGINNITKGSIVNISCRTLWAQRPKSGTGDRAWVKKTLNSSKEVNIFIARKPIVHSSALSTTDYNRLENSEKTFSQLSLSGLSGFNGETFLNKISFGFRGQYINPFGVNSDVGDGNVKVTTPKFFIGLYSNSGMTDLVYSTAEESSSDINGFIHFTPKDLNGDKIVEKFQSVPIFDQSFTPTIDTQLSNDTTYYWKAIVQNDEGNSDVVTDSFTTVPIRTATLSVENTSSKTPKLLWNYSGNTEQQFIRIRLYEKVSGSLIYNEYSQQFSSYETIEADPSLKYNVSYYAVVYISDGKTVTESNTIEFKLNAKPIVYGLKVDGRVNPTSVISSSIPVTWNFSSLDGASQYAYSIFVGSSEGDSDLFLYSAPGSANTVYLDSDDFPHQETIYVSVYAKSSSDGPYSDLAKATFVIHDPPNNPTLTAPMGGEKSNTTIEITWAEADPVHPGDSSVTYVLQYMPNRFGDEVYDIIRNISQGTTSYSWNVSEVPRGDLYAVRMFAYDGVARSDFSYSNSVFSITNHAPNAPTIDPDITGETFRHRIDIQWTEADPVDVDGDPVYYEIELMASSYPAESFERVARVDSGTSNYILNISGKPNGSNYRIRISAVSVLGDRSEYSTTGFFTIDNTSSPTDFASFNGESFMSTSDGKILKLVPTVLGKSGKISENWTHFTSENGTIIEENNHIIIESPEGSSAVLRHD